jgi:hypothetical protein
MLAQPPVQVQLPPDEAELDVMLVAVVVVTEVGAVEAVNVAVTDVVALIVSVQVDKDPEHAPPQAENV